MLKSDQQGFLIGEVLDVSKALLDGQRSGLARLARIDANVASMVGRANSGARRRMPPGVPALVAETAPRRGGPGARISPAGPVAPVRIPAAAMPSVLPVAAAAAVAVMGKMPARDGRGRFVKGGAMAADGKETGKGGRGGGGEGAGAPDEGRSSGENRLVEAIKEAAAQSTDRMDPMIEAAKEVWEPLGRGWRASFGQSAEKKKERWYKRIWQALTRKKEDGQTVGATPGVSSVGGGSGFAGLLSGASGLIGRAGGGLLGGAAGLLKRIPALNGAAGLLKRLPMVGALMAGGSAIYSAIQDDDPALTAEQNKTKRYRGVGGALGMGAGGIAGAAVGSLLGPVGTVAGGVLGATLGEKAGAAIGEWTKDVPEKIAELTKSPVVTAVVESAKAGAATASQVVAESAEKIVPEGIKKIAGLGSNALSLMMAALQGGISNPRKLAMFMGNMAHESGGFNSLEEKFNYSPKRLREVFGKRYFPTDKAAKDAVDAGPERIADIVYGGRMGNDRAGDGYRYRGRGFTQLTGKDNYAAASKAIGVDLVAQPELASKPDIASKIAVWFWNKRVASRGMDTSVEASRRAINGGLNGLDDTVRQTNKMSSAIAAASASAAGISLPAFPSAKLGSSIAPGPDVAFSSTPDHSERKVVSDRGEVSQNVSDRSIAHITTGGLGSGG